jgi:hypothetical protein
MMKSVWRGDLFLPALISRLGDEQTAMRQLAIEALSVQRSNAIVALTAFHAAS